MEHYKKQFPSIDVNLEAELAKFKVHREKLKELDLVGDTVGFIHKMRKEGKAILVEGANGALLDIDFGKHFLDLLKNSAFFIYLSPDLRARKSKEQ